METVSKPLRNPRSWRKAILSYYIWFALLGKPLLQSSFSTDAQESSVSMSDLFRTLQNVEEQRCTYTHMQAKIPQWFYLSHVPRLWLELVLCLSAMTKSKALQSNPSDSRLRIFIQTLPPILIHLGSCFRQSSLKSRSFAFVMYSVKRQRGEASSHATISGPPSEQGRA